MFSKAIEIMRTDQFSSMGGSRMQTVKRIDIERRFNSPNFNDYVLTYDWEDGVCMACLNDLPVNGLGYSEEEARLDAKDAFDSLYEYEEELLCLNAAS